MGNPHTANQTSYKNAMVGVCDILGFKTLLKSISLEEIIEDDFAYLRKALYASIHKKATPEHTPTLEEFQAQVIRTEQMLAMDWTRFLHKEFQLHWSREREIPLPNEAPSDVILKWYNTREFHMKVCKFCGEQSGTGKKRG